MVQRCTNPKHPKFKYWGGRGITVCARWRHSFENFIADLGRRPTPKHTIERVRNDLGYFGGNVVWATRKAQANNTRRNRKRIFKFADDLSQVDKHGPVRIFSLPEGYYVAGEGRVQPASGYRAAMDLVLGAAATRPARAEGVRMSAAR